MTPLPLLYLNLNRVLSGTAAGFVFGEDYLQACRFLHCGIVDRTRTMPERGVFEILDEIPCPESREAPSFAQLCDDRGLEVVERARQTDRHIEIMWSGGIDSTVALIAVVNAARQAGETDRIRMLLSLDSVIEAPDIFTNIIRPHFRFRQLTRPAVDCLDTRSITVTGEHGDQLFGSQLLRPYVQRGVAGLAWRDALPVVMLERLKNPVHAFKSWRYLLPVLEAAPVPLVTLFDALWWLNFALKWQTVQLRICALGKQRAGHAYKSLAHFFQTDDFQIWSMQQPSSRDLDSWVSYKREAKQYIFSSTRDQSYLDTKEKEDSLRNVLSARSPMDRLLVHMTNDFRSVVEVVPREEPTGIRGLARRLRSPDRNRPGPAYAT